MQEVAYACFDCADEDEVYITPEQTGLSNAYDTTNDIYRVIQGETCDVCGSEPALKRER